MANHKSSIKRIRANDAKRVRNKYQHKSARTVVKNLRSCTNRAEADKLLVQAYAMLDTLAKKSVIHKNKASNLKSSLALHVKTLA